MRYRMMDGERESLALYVPGKLMTIDTGRTGCSSVEPDAKLLSGVGVATVRASKSLARIVWMTGRRRPRKDL